MEAIRSQIFQEIDEHLQQRKAKEEKENAGRTSALGKRPSVQRFRSCGDRRDLFGRDLPATPTGAPTPRSARREVQAAREVTFSAESPADTPRRQQQSWWKAASVDDLKEDTGVSPLRSPRARREVRKALGTQRRVSDIGLEGGLFFSPPTRCPQEHRFGSESGQVRMRSSPVRSSSQASRESREECRYFCETPIGRRRPSAELPWQGFKAAGHATEHHRRFDTPAGEAALMGRARSQTPDYHRRYSLSAAGTSLPGSRGANAQVAPETPRSARGLRSSPFGSSETLTSSRNSEVACHFIPREGPWFSARKPLAKQAFSISSSSLPAGTTQRRAGLSTRPWAAQGPWTSRRLP